MVFFPDCSIVTADWGLRLINVPFPRWTNTFSKSDFVLDAKLICVFWDRSISLDWSLLIGISFVHNVFLMSKIHSFAHLFTIFVFCDWTKSSILGNVSYIGSIPVNNTNAIPNPIIPIKIIRTRCVIYVTANASTISTNKVMNCLLSNPILFLKNTSPKI